MFAIRIRTALTIICYFDCSHVKHVDYYYKFFFFASPDNGGYTEYNVEIQKASEDRDIWRGIHSSVSVHFRLFLKSPGFTGPRCLKVN